MNSSYFERTSILQKKSRRLHTKWDGRQIPSFLPGSSWRWPIFWPPSWFTIRGYLYALFVSFFRSVGIDSKCLLLSRARMSGLHFHSKETRLCTASTRRLSSQPLPFLGSVSLSNLSDSLPDSRLLMDGPVPFVRSFVSLSSLLFALPIAFKSMIWIHQWQMTHHPTTQNGTQTFYLTFWQRFFFPISSPRHGTTFPSGTFLDFASKIFFSLESCVYLCVVHWMHHRD